MSKVSNKLKTNKLIRGFKINECSKRQTVYFTKSLISNEEHSKSYWGKVFNFYYKKDKDNIDANESTSVWRSSFDGNPIPTTEMNEWIESTCNKLDKFINKDSRILEIGCGNGLIFSKIIKQVGQYTGIDSASYGLQAIANSTLGQKYISKLSLHKLEAININDITENDFDIVIINSVAQYFPNLTYLCDLIDKLQNKLSDKAIIFLGDLRALDLEYDFYKEVLEVQGIASIKSNIAKLKVKEKETLYSFELGTYMTHIFPWIKSSTTLLKDGIYANEMNKYRFDLILYRNSFDNYPAPKKLTFSTVENTLDFLKFDYFVILDIYNYHFLEDSSRDKTLKVIKKIKNKGYIVSLVPVSNKKMSIYACKSHFHQDLINKGFNIYSLCNNLGYKTKPTKLNIDFTELENIDFIEVNQKILTYL